MLEERLAKYRFDPKSPEFSNIGRTALRKKVEEIYRLWKEKSDEQKIPNEHNEDKSKDKKPKTD